MEIKIKKLAKEREQKSRNFVCGFCGQQCIKYSGLAVHIGKSHPGKLRSKRSQKSYYDKYILKEKMPPICLGCKKKKAKFVSLRDGYNLYCSRSCATKHITILDD